MGCCSSPSPPPAPDPQATASAQTESNLQTAIANAALNRVNQTTPWGNITYTQGPPDANGVPTWSSNIALSPEQQQLLDQQQQMQLTRGNIAQQLLGRVGTQLGQPLNLSNLHAVNNRGQMYTGAVNAGAGTVPGEPVKGPAGGNPINPGAQGGQGMGGGMALLAQMMNTPQGIALLQQIARGGGFGGMSGGAQPAGSTPLQQVASSAAAGMTPMSGGGPGEADELAAAARSPNRMLAKILRVGGA